MHKITDSFGELVFNDAVMKARLPEPAYRKLKDTIRMGKPLDADIAGIVANAMKDWAIDLGATHYTHWFQPLNGVTAEKHDSFIAHAPDGSGALMEFSGKELTMGEPDASSFPSGGLRATFEARGYTAWDPTSYAFIKDYILCIPTIFCSYGGDALDKKTPLLRSMELINTQALRVLKVFGHNDVQRVIPTSGPEQEYFLMEKALFDRRPDLIFCSRTLFGARPPKGQELEDHYFGAISPRVLSFMRDVNDELWRLGVYAKTEHKEVAPGQYELAMIYSNANIATDHNQLMMEILKRTAPKHGLVCLLHEKPFMGMNGSGKHNNWSLSTDTGMNLLDPGNSPKDNLQFLVFLSAVIKAVDEYHDLIRASVCGASNDCRLGGFEAPPAIISVFLGTTLYDLLASIERKEEYEEGARRILESGVCMIPKLRMDTTDRNRTSPFAFTGNKFEFRMPGSSHSTADSNTVINTIVSESLSEFANRLENAEDFRREVFRIVRHTMRDHKRILYNGNNYSDEWIAESAERGLLNLSTTVDALPSFVAEKNVQLFTRHNIYSDREIHSRYEIQLENYAKVIRIEADTMLEMVKRSIFPAVLAYVGDLADTVLSKKELGLPTSAEDSLLQQLSMGTELLHSQMITLEEATAAIPNTGALAIGCYCRDIIIPSMGALRATADNLETITAKEYWPLPTYEEMLFNL